MSYSLPTLRQIPSPNFSSRNGRKIDLLVAHDCEGNYAGSISWFANPKSMVSAHYVLKEDGTEATQMVDEANKAWHVVEFNSRAIGVEMAGYAAKGFAAPEWQSAANIFAYLLHRHSIPCQWSRDGLAPGFCSHYNLGAAGGGHRDPTTDPAIWAAFVDRVTAAYAQQAPASWATGATYTPPSQPPTFSPSSTVRHDLVVGSLDWVQAKLNAAGSARPPLNVDGIMGTLTKRALANYQTSHRLPVTSEADADTVRELEAV